jgi:hypothetical protein
MDAPARPAIAGLCVRLCNSAAWVIARVSRLPPGWTNARGHGCRAPAPLSRFAKRRMHRASCRGVACRCDGREDPALRVLPVAEVRHAAFTVREAPNVGTSCVVPRYGVPPRCREDLARSHSRRGLARCGVPIVWGEPGARVIGSFRGESPSLLDGSSARGNVRTDTRRAAQRAGHRGQVTSASRAKRRVPSACTWFRRALVRPLLWDLLAGLVPLEGVSTRLERPWTPARRRRGNQTHWRGSRDLA